MKIKTTLKIYDFKENVTDIMKQSVKLDKGRVRVNSRPEWMLQMQTCINNININSLRTQLNKQTNITQKTRTKELERAVSNMSKKKSIF